MPLRIVLLGTGEFALPSFKALIESDHEVAGIFTQPDRTGRGHHRHVNSVKQLAEEHGIPVFQPPRVNRPDVLDELRLLNADAFIVAAYGQILKPEFLEIPRLGAFNLHGSLLPRHRGAAPVQYSIWKGDQETGVTIFRIEPALDSGPIAGVVETEIGSKETSGDLMLRLAELSAPLALDVVNQLEHGTARFARQNPSLVTLAPKIRKHDGVIDWTQSPRQIDCHVRAMQPWPKAATWLVSKTREPLRCIILTTNPDPQSLPENVASGSTGTVLLADKRLLVQTGGGVIEICRLQPDGKGPMDATAFLNGYRISGGMQFGGTADTSPA
ncbi:MAG: methionyl-tRNA formyltransferase [Planctomycetaceae bacterium]